MKKLILLTIAISFHLTSMSQETKKSSSEILLKELSENACKCVDSIETYNVPKNEVVKKISKCINKQTLAYQLGVKLSNIEELDKNEKSTEEKKEIEININADENSKEYKKYYREIERYMMTHCASLKKKMSSNEKLHTKSMSLNEKALKYYDKGLKESKKKNFKKAIKYYKKAIKEDPEFAFAWDNLGLNYRRLNKFDQAIDAYENSLKIDPYGTMPLQNIAVAYQYKKEFNKAIDAFKKLAEIDKNNPEVYYGIGNIYTINLKEYEKGLDYLCKAYNLYVEQKSPYRTDAEKFINLIYSEMKKQGKEEKFNEILKANNISTN